MNQAEEEVKELLKSLAPEQRAVAENIARLQIENRMLQRQAKVLRDAYDDLYKVMIVILDCCHDKELRINDTQFMRFKEEYRIDRTHDELTHEVVLRLRTLRDPVEETKDE